MDARSSGQDRYVVTSDMDLYAAYRTLQPEPIGLTMGTLSQTPERDPEFYAYLEEYLESRYPDEMAALREMESQAAFDAAPLALSKSRVCYEHAYNDAEWMLTKRPDADFGKEIVYQYTSHCIDVMEDSVGTFCPCSVDNPSNYLTDLDRRTYDLFYSKASGITIYKNVTSLIGLAASGAGGAGVDTVRTVFSQAKLSEKFFNIAKTGSDGYDFVKAVTGLSNAAYPICSIPAKKNCLHLWTTSWMHLAKDLILTMGNGL